MTSISARIRLLRTNANLTQEEFGKIFGIVKSTVSLYESGKSCPNDQIKLKICEYFDVPTDYLLGRGVFSDIETLEKAKPQVLNLISTITAKLSVDVLNGLDEITYIKLVDAFKIKITSNSDGTFGLTARDPFPTYPADNEVLPSAPPSSIDTNIDAELVRLIASLPHDSQIELKGYVKRMMHESVAADSLKEAK